VSVPKPHPRSVSEALRGKTLVVGLGVTGLSCARYLTRQGVEVAVTDSRLNPPGLEKLQEELPDLAVFIGGFRAEVFAAAERIVLSPGVSLAEPMVQSALARGVRVVGDIELLAEVVRVPVVAITGSNGKSTVTTLFGEMANRAGIRVAVGGNLGRPALDLLEDEADLLVLELSSFQLETTSSLRAEAAVVLNVSADHMDRYPDLVSYTAAKARIYHGCRHGVLNRDDPLVAAMTGLARKETGFTLGTPGASDFGVRTVRGEEWLCKGKERLLPASELLISGRHNVANALAALALGDACSFSVDSMLEALRRFRGLAHRCQLVAKKGGIRWYNDSKGTNVGATIASLEGLHPRSGSGRTVLLAGGDGKGADFAPLAPVVKRTARVVVLFGRDAPRIEEALRDTVALRRAASLSEAVQIAAEEARPGDRVLLSPACASFDMFRNYEHRGEAFCTAVSELPE